jgi:hypothetical protein
MEVRRAELTRAIAHGNSSSNKTAHSAGMLSKRFGRCTSRHSSRSERIAAAPLTGQNGNAW